MEKEYKTTEARRTANARYKEKNKEKQRYWENKSKAKAFIIDSANLEDLVELNKFATNKIKEIRGESKMEELRRKIELRSLLQQKI